MAPFPQRIRLPRRLYLDDLGTHIAEKPAAEGAGKQHAEFNYANTRKRTWPGGVAGFVVRDGHFGHLFSFSLTIKIP
jgi:hypothetical protein